MTSKNLKNEIADTVSGAEHGAWLELSTEEISANADVLARAKPRGRYRLQASVAGYCADLRRSATGREGPLAVQRKRLLRAQADLSETQAKAEAGTLVVASDVLDRWSSLLRGVRSMVMALPGRVAALIPSLSRADTTVIDDIVRAALTEAATYEATYDSASECDIPIQPGGKVR